MGLSRGYRAVSLEEYRDIRRSAAFRRGPNSLERKWFADSLDGAKAHGRALYPNTEFVLVEADLPDDVPSFFWLPNLDNKGPARYLSVDDLAGVVPRLPEEG